MATCKSCGTEIGETNFCPACGMSQGDNNAQTAQTISAAPSPTYMPMGDTQGQTTTQSPNTAPYYPQQSSAGMPNRSGQMIFSIVNIVLGAVFCCCTGISLVTMILGIIATVMCTQVDKAASVEEANHKLNTVKILNIVAVCLLALGIIGMIIIYVAFPSTNSSWEYWNSYAN